MNFYYPIFGLFLIFVAWQAYERSKATRESAKASADFWQRETDANSVRRKPLDQEDYITISDELLLNNLCADAPNEILSDELLISYSETLNSLMDKRILNLTGMTTTDIKMAYGVANLNEVTEYDENYTKMIQNIASYGTRLMDLNMNDEAIKVFEFGIDSLTDISTNYKHLAKLYISKNEPEKIHKLIETAEKLDSLMKASIIETLKEMIDELPSIN